MSSPKIVEPDIGTAEDHSPERCGYCSKQKRPENRDNLSPNSGHLCKCPNASDSSDPNIRLGAVPSSAFRRSPSPRPSLVPPPSPCTVTGTEICSGDTKYEVISVREKHGDFRKAIPHMPMPLAIVLCLFNVLLPGTGTLVSSFTVLCGCPTELDQKGRSLAYNLLAALLQVITAPIIVGWIWSVLWGITFVNISVSKAVEEPNASTMI